MVACRQSVVPAMGQVSKEAFEVGRAWACRCHHAGIFAQGDAELGSGWPDRVDRPDGIVIPGLISRERYQNIANMLWLERRSTIRPFSRRSGGRHCVLNSAKPLISIPRRPLQGTIPYPAPHVKTHQDLPMRVGSGTCSPVSRRKHLHDIIIGLYVGIPIYYSPELARLG